MEISKFQTLDLKGVEEREENGNGGKNEEHSEEYKNGKEKKNEDDEDENEDEDEEKDKIELNKSLVWFHPSSSSSKNSLFSNEKINLKPISTISLSTPLTTSITTSNTTSATTSNTTSNTTSSTTSITTSSSAVETDLDSINDILSQTLDPVRNEVVECLTKMIFSVARSLRVDPVKKNCFHTKLFLIVIYKLVLSFYLTLSIVSTIKFYFCLFNFSIHHFFYLFSSLS